MSTKIDILRTVGQNLKPQLSIEGKHTINPQKIKNIIPGAVALAGTTITLETKNDSVCLDVIQNNELIQRAAFQYMEDNDEYKWISAENTYNYNNINKKILRHNKHFITENSEYAAEKTIDYKDAPIRQNTQNNLDKIHLFITKIIDKFDNNQKNNIQPKTFVLQKFFTQLMGLTESLLPQSSVNISLKEKQKQDGKTFLFAFKADDVKDNSTVAKGFISTDMDTLTYHLDTKDAVIIGECSDKMAGEYYQQNNSYKAYLKSEQQEVQNNRAEVTTNTKDQNVIPQNNKTEIETKSITPSRQEITQDKFQETSLDEHSKQIIQMYRDGQSIEHIARTMHHSDRNIKRILQQAENYEQLKAEHDSHNVRNNKEEIEEIKRFYLEGKTISQIAEIVHHREKTISEIVKSDENYKQLKAEHDKNLKLASCKKNKTEQIKKMYRDGYIVSQIAKTLNYNADAVSNILRNDDNYNQIESEHAKNLKLASYEQTKREQIKKMYAQGQSIEQIAEIVGYQTTTINKILRSNNDEFADLQQKHNNSLYSKNPTEIELPVTQEEIKPEIKRNQTPVHTMDYYSEQIVDAAIENSENKTISLIDKKNNFVNVLVTAYLDGYDEKALKTILHCDGCVPFGDEAKDVYIKLAVQKAQTGELEPPSSEV